MDRIDQILERLVSIESLLLKQENRWLTISETAVFLQKSERTVRRYLDRGLLSRHGFQGTIRIDKKDLNALMVFGKPWKKLITRQREQLRARDL